MREIRKTQISDLEVVLNIFDNARTRMRAEGNLTQWLTHPDRSVILGDICDGVGYVIVEDEEIIGTFMFKFGPDPTYAQIDGCWLSDEPYGVIHRIAGDGKHHGILKTAVDFVSKTIQNIRIDTHSDNISMQNALKCAGFEKCGTIYISDDYSDRSPRVAFQKDKFI